MNNIDLFPKRLLLIYFCAMFCGSPSTSHSNKLIIIYTSRIIESIVASEITCQCLDYK